MRQYLNGTLDPHVPKDNTVCLIKSALDLTKSPFTTDDLFVLDVSLPPKEVPLQIMVCDDLVHDLPYIEEIPLLSPLHDQVPTQAQQNIFIVVIDNEEPILAKTASDLLQQAHAPKSSTTIKLVFAPRLALVTTDLEMHHAFFDMGRLIYQPLINIYEIKCDKCQKVPKHTALALQGSD